MAAGFAAVVEPCKTNSMLDNAPQAKGCWSLQVGKDFFQMVKRIKNHRKGFSLKMAKTHSLTKGLGFEAKHLQCGYCQSGGKQIMARQVQHYWKKNPKSQVEAEIKSQNEMES